MKLSILGAGKWGCALAFAAQKSGCKVLLWNRPHRKTPYQSNLTITPHLQEALNFAPVCIIAVAAQSVSSLVSHLLPPTVLIASKGLDQSTGRLMSEVIASVSSCHMGVLGGPNLAQEVMQGVPCGLTVASHTQKVWEDVQACFQNGSFILEFSQDPVGVQVAGALKNVMAIGYGLLQQHTHSENLLATYLVKALQEMISFAKALGGRQETFSTYAGMGDLVLTCTSQKSRNNQYGRLFPKESLDTLAEGRLTIEAVIKRTRDLRLNLPLVTALYEVLMHRHPQEYWTQVVCAHASQK